MRSRALVTLFVLGCQRTDASTTTSAPITSAASAPASSVAVLTPLFTAAPAPSSVASSSSTPTVRALAPARSIAKRAPLSACCEALRKQDKIPPLAVAACDGVVSTLDESDAAPQLEELLRPMLVGVAVPSACKGL